MRILFLAYIDLALYAAGMMTGLQLQHFAFSPAWQAPLHARLAGTGFHPELVNKIMRTKWLRTVALLAQAAGTLAAVDAGSGA